MSPRKFFLFVVFGILFVSCQQQKTLKEYMTDSWQTSYLKLEMPTYEKKDTLQIFEEKFDNNPEQIAQSKYNADGTFSAWFVDREGNYTSDSDGKWSIDGDSLRVEFFYDGRNMKVAYHITKTEEGFMGVSKYDWDNDGEYDDLLTMKTKRINLEK